MEVGTLLVLVLTFLAIIWYSWETRGMRREMGASRLSADRQLELLQDEHERRYDAHVAVRGWEPSLARLTLVNSGPGPAVEVSIRARTREVSGVTTEDRLFTGSAAAIPVGGTLELSLTREMAVPSDFPASEGQRLTVELVVTTALGEPMPKRVSRPLLGA